MELVDLPLKKTYLEGAQPLSQQGKIASVLKGSVSPENLDNNQFKELQLALVEQKLGVKELISKYKDVIEAKDVKYRGSDVLKALDSVREMWQLKDKSDDQLQIRALIQTKTIDEITTTLIEVTGKTQEYLTKLKELDGK